MGHAPSRDPRVLASQIGNRAFAQLVSRWDWEDAVSTVADVAGAIANPVYGAVELGKDLAQLAAGGDGEPAQPQPQAQPPAPTPKAAPTPKPAPAPTPTPTPDPAPAGDGPQAVLERAKGISAKGYKYIWGGGHRKVGVPDIGQTKGPDIGFDCSGYTTACLAAGGMMPTVSWVPNSTWFEDNYGEPGEGKLITVWANGHTAENRRHVFIEFKLGGDIRYADTSNMAGGPTGARTRTGKRSTNGFKPRHWPGT